MVPICRARRRKRACLIAGASLLFAPPYSPDLKPIEMAFAAVPSGNPEHVHS